MHKLKQVKHFRVLVLMISYSIVLQTNLNTDFYKKFLSRNMNVTEVRIFYSRQLSVALIGNELLLNKYFPLEKAMVQNRGFIQCYSYFFTFDSVIYTLFIFILIACTTKKNQNKYKKKSAMVKLFWLSLPAFYERK